MNHTQDWLRDPTAETSSVKRTRRTPPQSLAGLRVGLFGIGKNRTDEFLDRVQQRFEERGLQVQRFAKPTNARTAPPEVMEQVVQGCDVVLVGLSD